MNCANHSDVVAVSSCGLCNCGICKECMEKAIRMENGKLYCKNCAFDAISTAIEGLNTQLYNIVGKKIIWSVILALGVCAMIGGSISEAISGRGDYSGWIIVGVLIWACAGVTDRVLNKKEKSVQDSVYDANMLKDNPFAYIMINLVFWLIKALCRGVIFPFIYIHFMLRGAKDLNDKIAEQQAILDSIK